MVLRRVRIGAVPDAVQFDDGDYDSAIETDQPIKAGDPVDPNDVVTLGSSGIRTKVVSDITNPTELNTMTGSAGWLVVACKVNGAGVIDSYTIYAYDANGPAVNSPYVVDASGAGSERWIAIAGNYSYIDSIINAVLTVRELRLHDIDRSNYLYIMWNENELNNRTLKLQINGADRTVNLFGNVSLNQDLQTTDDVNFNSVQCQGTQVLTIRQAAEADAGSVSAIALAAGADTVDMAAFNTNLTTMVSEINGIKSTLNNILGKLRTHGLIAP